jgi:hypothetical protein
MHASSSLKTIYFSNVLYAIFYTLMTVKLIYIIHKCGLYVNLLLLYWNMRLNDHTELLAGLLTLGLIV